MKVLSMIQPWASLFILDEAKYETRTWKTNYRGPLGIHTSRKKDVKAINNEYINPLLRINGLVEQNIPTGCIIGVCNLVNCIKVVEDHQTWAILEDGKLISESEYKLGDYREGNYAWEVIDKKMIHPYIEAKGQLGLWEYEIK